jgi:hypothetical protein
MSVQMTCELRIAWNRVSWLQTADCRPPIDYMHQNTLLVRHIVAYILGAAAALLLARIVLKLFAARPDNPVVAALFTITTPPPALAALDAGQPRFGAALEFSTLALIVLLLALGLLLRRIWRSRSPT